jgi:hypothetical protein
MDSPDPVIGNPFREDDVRHSIWEKATSAADEEICGVRDLFLGSRPDSLEAAISCYVQLVTGTYNVWAKRGVHVVLDRESIQPFGQWLANYANEWLKTLKAFFPSYFPTKALLGETSRALIGRREYWKAEAMRFVEKQEAFQATRPQQAGEAAPKAAEAPALRPSTVLSSPLRGIADGAMAPLSWLQIRDDFRQGEEAYPNVRAHWESREDLWTLQNAPAGRVPTPADLQAQRLFIKTARAAVIRLGKPLDEQPPWHVWLDLMRKTKRGFHRIRVARTFSVFRMVAERKGIPASSDIRLLDDGTIEHVFQVSGEFCDDLALGEAEEVPMRAADGGLPPANQAGATKPDVDSPNPAEADLAVNEANGNEATLEQPATATVGGKGGARWSDVEICFLDADHAQVTVLDKVTRLSYAEMGFGDRRGVKVGDRGPNQSWGWLRRFAEKRGTIELPERQSKPAPKGPWDASRQPSSSLEALTAQRSGATKARAELHVAMKGLRRSLRSHFGIEDNPILFESNRYTTQFRIGCSPSYHE